MKENINQIGVWNSTTDFIALGGNLVGLLPQQKIDEILCQVKDELVKDPAKTIAEDEASLKKAALNGMAVVVLCSEGATFKGFGQLKPVHEKDDPQLPLKALCFNSWVGKGGGREALSAAVNLGKAIDPTLPIVAKVRDGNERALALMAEMGATIETIERGKTVFNISGVKG